MKKKLCLKMEELFGLDLRSLALFRIGVGMSLLYDLIVRATALTAHYSDAGILPRLALLEKFPSIGYFSFHLLSGSPFFQSFLFLLTGLAALALIFGYRTRTATLIAWLLLLSLHNRNPMILQRGDILLRMFLFWGLFLPWANHCSLDQALNSSEEKKPTQVTSAATVALLLQICFVYWFTVGLKAHSVWWDQPKAIEYALRIDQMVKPFGRFLLQFPQILPFLTRATILLEIAGPILAFFPFFNGFFRTLAVFLMIGFHFGLWLSLNLGLFPYISSVGWLAFLPGSFWDKFASRLTLPRSLKDLFQKGKVSVITFLTARNLKGSPPKFILSKPAQIFVSISLLYVFLWNVRTLNFDKYRRYFPTAFNGPGDLLRIDQMWDMFSPSPLREDGWYVIPGRLKNGTEVDLFRNGAPVNWGKPAFGLKDYPIERWQKYMMNIAQTNYSDHRLYFAQYLCRQWNSTHPGPQQVERFEIDFMMELTQIDGQEASPQKMMLWEQKCLP